MVTGNELSYICLSKKVFLPHIWRIISLNVEIYFSAKKSTVINFHVHSYTGSWGAGLYPGWYRKEAKPKQTKKAKQGAYRWAILWVLRSSPASPTVIPFLNLLVDPLCFALEFLVSYDSIRWNVLTPSCLELEVTFLISCT